MVLKNKTNLSPARPSLLGLSLAITQSRALEQTTNIRFLIFLCFLDLILELLILLLVMIILYQFVYYSSTYMAFILKMELHDHVLKMFLTL